MEKFFWTGLAIGMLGGALIVSNSYKARQLVRMGGQKIKDEVEKILNEKCAQEDKGNGGEKSDKNAQNE